MLLKQVQNDIKRHHLFNQNDEILVAVSGGADSVVLLDVLVRLGYRCQVAHCNFQLRGADSQSDFEFVKALAKHYGLTFHNIVFDTNQVAQERKISIEMAARELRYAWFESLAVEIACARVALGHHANDNAETMLLNLARGTGIKGMIGIPRKRGIYVRPLLAVSRTEIEKYAYEHGLSWCTDITNGDIDFKRNHIRHIILPELSKQNPSFVTTMDANSQRFADAAELYAWSLKQLLPQFLIQQETNWIVDSTKLLTLPAPQSLLFETMSSFGFDASTVHDLYHNLLSQSGKRFLSPDYQAIIYQNKVLIEPVLAERHERYFISEEQTTLENPICLKIAYQDKADDFKPLQGSDIACLDADKLLYPLVLRHWEQGDKFCPLGMNRFKKLSDFFIDNKLNLFDKERIWLLSSGDAIVWIIGHRIDHRYRVTADTKRLCIIQWVC